MSCLVHFDIYIHAYIFWSVSTFKYHQTNDGILSMSACYFSVRSYVLFSFKKQTCKQCCSVALHNISQCITQASATRLRCGHVCLVGIDVVASDDDPISEQLTIIIIIHNWLRALALFKIYNSICNKQKVQRLWTCLIFFLYRIKRKKRKEMDRFIIDHQYHRPIGPVSR